MRLSQVIRLRREGTIMSNHDGPDDRVSNEEEAELRAFRRVASALERGDIDELAAALLEESDPAGLGRRARRPKEN
jgi:hypothetical protein